MARKERFVNNAATTLSGGISIGATSLVVSSATDFPTEGDFRLLIGTEILLVTAVSGTTFTVQRGADNSIAASHSNADPVTAIVTKGALDQFMRDIDPWSNLKPPFRIVDTNGDPLTSTDFTEVNFTSNAVSSDQDGNITISKDDHTTTNVTSLVRTAPSTPYTITAAITWNLLTDNVANAVRVGLIFRESGTGKMMSHGIQPDSATSFLVIARASPTGSGTSFSPHRPRPSTQPMWLRLEDDGVDIKFHLSTDGVNWNLGHSEVRGANFTTAPDQVGFMINNDDGVDDNSVSLIAWDGE